MKTITEMFVLLLCGGAVVLATAHQAAKLFIAAKAGVTPDTIPGPLRDALFHWLHREGVLRLTKITLLQPGDEISVDQQPALLDRPVRTHKVD